MLVINSFNESRFGGVWTGFSLKWYARLFKRANVDCPQQFAYCRYFFYNRLNTLGHLRCFALHSYESKLRRAHFLIYTPLVSDILMGISLLLFFFALNIQLGLLTITIARTTFCISYVAMVMLGKLQNYDFSLVEAAQDLGSIEELS